VTAARNRRSRAPRVGIFGKIGAGNIGNDASMEAILNYLSSAHPEAVVDAMCTGPDIVKSKYGVEAVPLSWHHRFKPPRSEITTTALKILGRNIDVFRTAAWVRRHDTVIVPGAGVLESSLPLRAVEFPYSMFLICGCSRLFGTKVALVSVGASAVNQRLTRWLFDAAARLASYRSYRNTGSRDAMRQRGLDTAQDHIYTDLVFSLPAPPIEPGDPQLVCIGVMEFHGTNDDRGHADEIRSSYVDGMKCFVRWLVDNDRRVMLVVGDANGSDDNVAQEILADLRETRPNLDPSWAVAQPVDSYDDVMRAMQPAGSVVAIRFHNVIAALKLCKPTIAISYSPKHDALMAEMGMPRFSQPVNPFDHDLLIKRFVELESNSEQFREVLMRSNAANEQLLREQFAELSAVLFPGDRAA
jgi:polysaccharide pyruvyl transferase WcaK-like protein